MNCQEAQRKLDERMQAESEGPIADRDQWTQLDAHLDRCPKCTAAWNELRRTRVLLADAAREAPKTQEIETMWNAIAHTSAGTVALKSKASFSLARGWQFAAAFAGVAVILGAALTIGLSRYDREIRLAAARSNIRDIATSSRIIGEYGWQLFASPSNSAPSSSSSKSDSIDVDSSQSPAINFGYQSPYSDEGQSRNRKPRTKSKVSAPAAAPAEESLAQSSAEEQNYRDSIRTMRRGSQSTDAVSEASTGTVSGDAATGKLKVYYDSSTGELASSDRESGAALLHSLSYDPPESTPSDQTAGQPSPASPAKIIKTGSLTLEVEVYADAFKQVEDTVRQFDAFVADVSTREQAGGAVMATIKIRVAPASFAQLFAALKTIGRTEAEDVRANDVTEEYVDVESQISSLETMEKRLADLIANKSFVDKISSLLDVERELKRVRTQREQLLGRLRVMQDRIALSTITLTLHEPPRNVPEASISIESPTLEDAARNLGNLLARLNGRLVSGTTATHAGGTLSGTYRLQISLSHFAELLNGIESLGHVARRAVNDQQFGKPLAPWAENVPCIINLNIDERSQELPSGAMTLEVDALTAALRQVEASVSPLSGSIVSNQSTRKDDGSQEADLVIQVPARSFSELVDSLTAVGRTTDKDLSGNISRIVGGAADTPCRLTLTLAERTREVPSGYIKLEVADFDAARTTLSRIVGEKDVHVSGSSSNQQTDGSWSGSFSLGIPAGEMESVVTQLESLGRVVSRQISGLGLGDLSQVHPDTIGVINLMIGEPETISPGPDQAGQSIRTRLRDGFVVMYTSLGLIAYGLVVMVPWLLIVLLPAWLLYRMIRKRKPEPTVSQA